jgi:hypothetical protein
MIVNGNTESIPCFMQFLCELGGTLEPAFRTSPQGADLAPCLQAMQLNVDRNQVIQDDVDHSFT